jgi:hypothetical protein
LDEVDDESASDDENSEECPSSGNFKRPSGKHVMVPAYNRFVCRCGVIVVFDPSIDTELSFGQ